MGVAIESAAPGGWQDVSLGPSEARRDKKAERRRATLYGTPYKKPRVLVRRFRGCLDEIPERSSRLLVLRYGIGDFEPQPAARVARRLGLSRRQYVRQKRRALRRLVVAARGSRCERQHLSVSVVGADFEPVSATSWPAADAGVSLVSTAGTSTPSQARGDVLGRSKSNASDDDRAAAKRPFGTPSLDLASPSQDLPFLLAILALCSFFGWLLFRRARTATDRLEDPSKVGRMRR